MQRTYSDPDLPQLLPLPVRPSSSYEPRPKAKEHPQFSPRVVDAMAKKMNIDVQVHEDYRWIPRDCLLALRDEGWTCVVRDGDLEFLYAYNEETRADHPIFDAHQRMAKNLLNVEQQLKMKRLDPLFRVRHLVYLAIMGEKDIRGVTNPHLIEEVMGNLDVNPKDEPHLVQRIKISIEDAYYRMQKVGRHTITIENCVDVESLQVNLELDRVGFMKKISPSGLLYCVECQTALGDVISAGNHDVLCNCCAAETHSSGRRLDVQMVFMEQVVCAECGAKSSLVRCQDCVELFCYDCFKATHSRGKRQRHCVSLPTRTFCFECDEREASYICVECEDALCTRCTAKIHRAGARQNHTLFGLRKAAYTKKLFGDNLDRLMGIIQKNVERSYSLSPWFVFYDSALAPFWYNFQTHEQIRADPNDLVNPPLGIAGEDDGEGTGMPASADEQLLRALPGATVLRDTHAARFASQAACFDVPPPMQVKFRSPIA